MTSRWATGALFVIVAVIVVACNPTSSGSSESTLLEPEPTTTTTIIAAEATAAYAQCLRDEGVAVDDIPVDANGRPMLDAINSQLDYSDPATIDALTACAGLLTEGALDLGYDDSYREAVVAQLSAFSRCMRARGVDEFPDPVPGFIGIGSPYPVAEIPYDDPDMQVAASACEETVFGDFPGSGE